MVRKVTVITALVGALLMTGPALAESTQAPPEHIDWSFNGPFGHYDQEQLQRGYKVYHEVCSSCHALSMIAFRNLGDKGGPFWDPKYPNANDNPQIKAIAKDFQIADIDSDSGDAIKRPGITADYYPSPFANEAAARASNGGALPPDMSLLAKAREGGPDYIYSIVTGDNADAPNGLTVPPGKYYDKYISGDLSGNWKGPADHVPVGGFIAMPPPLSDDKVTFDDGKKATTRQEAMDVAAFLEWAADPKMEERKESGVAVMFFLLLLTGVLYASYRNIWRKVGH